MLPTCYTSLHELVSDDLTVLNHLNGSPLPAAFCPEMRAALTALKYQSAKTIDKILAKTGVRMDRHRCRCGADDRLPAASHEPRPSIYTKAPVIAP